MVLARSWLVERLAGDAEMQDLLSDERQLERILAFERELARAEAVSGLIPDNAADAISSLLGSFVPDNEQLAAGIAKDGVVVPELVRQIKAARPQFAEFVHAGATSQDAIDTAAVLSIKDALELLEARIGRVIEAIRVHSDTAGTRQLMAHTRMQRAVGFTVADKLETWVGPLRRYKAGLPQLAEAVAVVQLGGPVGDRAWFGEKAEAVAADLAKGLGLRPVAAWHSQRDRMVSFGSWLALVTGSLGKIGADVALLAQNELGEITLTGGGSSSAMAHKSNPVLAEVLVALAHYNAGLCGILQSAMVHENERSGSAWTLEWLTLPEMLVATAASLRAGEDLLRSIIFAP